VNQHRGSHTARGPEQSGEAEAHARLEALFALFDRLTPDELARIGLRGLDAEARRELMQAVEAAARTSDRSQLLGEARSRARETVLRRYAEGGLHPTWVGLNWGISQGTVEDRVAIIEALEDAAAASVVEDLVDPEVAESLALDAGHVLDMAAGDVSEGSLAHVLTPPAEGLHDTRMRWVGVWVAAFVFGSTAFGAGAVVVGVEGGVAAGIVAAAIVVALARRGSVVDEAAPKSESKSDGGAIGS
jgi:hypothetical protein